MIHPEGISQLVLAILSKQSVYALLLFPLIWGLVKCCRGQYPRWQHALWFLILLRLILPPDLSAPWSASHLIRSAAPSLVSRSIPRANLFFSDHQKPLSFFPDPFNPDRRNAPEMARTTYPQSTAIRSPIEGGRLTLIICSIWLTIVGLLLTLFLRNRRRYWKIAGDGKTVLDPAILDIVQTWRERLHISRTVRIKKATSDIPPFTIGLFRPVVVLPHYLNSPAGTKALEAVIAHELVHVKRWDDLGICFQELVRILYFFHPLVWFIIPRLNWTREAVCDTTVLSFKTLSPGTYGREMLAFAQHQASCRIPPPGLAKFTAAAKSMAFRLKHIQMEENMKSNPLTTYLVILLLGIFLLPMAQTVSSNQISTAPSLTGPASKVQQRMADNALIRYIQGCIPCQNPDEVARIIWGDLITDEFQEEDFSRLVSATDCDMIQDIGNGQKAYVFYLLRESRQGVRPSFHFVKKQHKLALLFHSHYLTNYATDRPKVNGYYEIEEGWRADLFDGINDDRVSLAWGSRVWFWTGTQYLAAYTEYEIKEATEPSLIGTKREWQGDVRPLYEAASRR